MKPRGYTVVELMIALAVLAIGVSGIIAMQKVTLAANQHARTLGIATHIAQTWQDQLAADAVLWNYPGPRPGAIDTNDTRWLKIAFDGDQEGEWVLPAYETDFGPAFDALGNVVPEADDHSGQVVFCTHIRLTRLRDSGGMGLIRSEVRVFWLRDGGPGPVEAGNVCAPIDPDTVTGAIENYHFVYQTTAIKQNTAQ